jgi:hypothetical protein
MTVLAKAFYRFHAIPIKISMSFFTDTEKSIPKFIWKHKRPPKAKEILHKKSNMGGITVLAFKLFYKAIVTKIAWY